MAMEKSTTISLIALVISFGTTLVTYVRTYKQDIHDKQKELRELLGRLVAIPRESLEIYKKHAGDQNTLFSFSQLYNQENTLLSRQAAQIARKLPAKLVSATEYLSIATALQRAYNLVEAREFLLLAETRAAGFNDKIAAIRTLAGLDYVVGEVENGRANFQRALAIFGTYKGYDSYTVTTTHIVTELQWATSEAGVGQMAMAYERLNHAKTIAESLPYSPGAESFKMQVAETFARFSAGGAAKPPMQPSAG